MDFLFIIRCFLSEGLVGRQDFRSWEDSDARQAQLPQNIREQLIVGESKSSITVFTLSILVTELVSIGKMDDYLETANLALEE